MQSVRSLLERVATGQQLAQRKLHTGGYEVCGGRGQRGFTIIEVMLFLAITGMLFLVGFWGTGQQIGNVRFSDSMRSTQSYLQKQYASVGSGVNAREASFQCSDPGALGQPPVLAAGTPVANDTAGDAADCVLLGKLIKLSANTGTITTYSVVGQRLVAGELTGDDFTDLRNSGPTLSPQGVETFAVNWGVTFHQPSTTGAANQSQAFAYLRSPSTGRIISFAFSNDAVSAATVPGSDAAFRAALTTANQAQNAGYCFQDGSNRQGLLKIGYDQRGEAIDIQLADINLNADCVRSKP